MLRSLDEALGRIRRLLAAAGRLDETYIVVTSDNGWHHSHHNLPPWKGTAFEEDVRVPLVMRGPGVPAGRTIGRLVTNADLAPTLAAWAGADRPEVDGRSLVPLIENPGIPWRNGFLVEGLKYTAVRADDYIYVRHSNGALEVYDLVKDPYQLKNAKGVLPWKNKIAALDLWRTELEGCEGSSCAAAENRAAP